jgi:hypothetical protein
MKPSDHLHQLIRSMSAAEQRHFTLNARRYSPSGEDKKYVQLFKAIAKQAVYNEALVKSRLSDTIPSKNFASWKRHLLAYLEAAIREFHAGKDSEELVHEYMRDAELMHRRGLWARARKKIADSKAIALRLGDFLALLKINEVERRLVIEFDQRQIEQKTKTLMAEASDYLEKLQTEWMYAALFEEVRLLVRLKFDSRDLMVVERLPSLLRDARLHPQPSFPNFRAQRYHHQARAFVFHLANQPENELQAYVELRALWDAYPFFKKTYPKLYKLSLANYLHVANKLKRWEDFPSVLDAMAALPPENFNEAAEDFQTIEFFRYLYLIDTRQLQQALELIPRIQTGLLRFSVKINHARWLSFQLNMALTYFLNGQIQDAKIHVENIISASKSDHRTDAQSLARLLEPILIFEMGDPNLAHYRLQALREWLRTHERLFDFEKLVISRLEAILNAGPSGLLVLFERFHQELQVLRTTQPHLQGLDVIAIWVDARRTQRPLPIAVAAFQ